MMLEQQSQHGRMDQYSGETHPHAFCLVLLVQHTKNKELVTKKRLYDFEHPLNYLKKRDSSCTYNLVFKLRKYVEQEGCKIS